MSIKRLSIDTLMFQLSEKYLVLLCLEQPVIDFFGFERQKVEEKRHFLG